MEREVILPVRHGKAPECRTTALVDGPQQRPDRKRKGRITPCEQRLESFAHALVSRLGTG